MQLSSTDQEPIFKISSSQHEQFSQTAKGKVSPSKPFPVVFFRKIISIQISTGLVQFVQSPRGKHFPLLIHLTGISQNYYSNMLLRFSLQHNGKEASEDFSPIHILFPRFCVKFQKGPLQAQHYIRKLTWLKFRLFMQRSLNRPIWRIFFPYCPSPQEFTKNPSR